MSKRNKLLFSLIIILFLSLPIFLYVINQRQDIRSRAAVEGFTVEEFLDSREWVSFENEKYNFSLQHSKCMRPFAANSFDDTPGWVFRCEDGKTRMEFYLTDLSYEEMREKFPVSRELEFGEYNTGIFSGWRGIVPDRSVYYFFERDGRKNILIVGHLDKFSEPSFYAEALLDRTVSSLRNLN